MINSPLIWEQYKDHQVWHGRSGHHHYIVTHDEKSYSVYEIEYRGSYPDKEIFLKDGFELKEHAQQYAEDHRNACE